MGLDVQRRLRAQDGTDPDTHTHVTHTHSRASHPAADTLLGQVIPHPRELGLACPQP